MSLWNTLLAEIRKTATLPAAWAGTAVAVLGSAALTAVNARSVRSAAESGTPELVADTSTYETGFSAMPILGTVGAVIIGVIVFSSEYAADRAESGGGRQIATTLASTPGRTSLFVAKALTVLLFVALNALLAIPSSFAIAHLIIGDAGTEIVTHEEALARCAGAVVYWMLSALIALAITALVRSGVVPLIFLIVNNSLVSFSLLLTNLTPLAHWLPDMAGRKLFGIGGVEGGLEPIPGGIVMGVWALLALVVAGVVFRRRDA